MGLILVIVLVILFCGGIGTLPHWGYHDYGWGPSGGFGLILIIVVIVLLFRGRF